MVLAALALAASPSQAERMHMLVPAYSYPFPGSSYWAGLNSAAARLPLVAIADPDNGPGPAFDPNYGAALGALHAAGGRYLGYVFTTHAARPLAAVLADVARWPQFYSIDGIFVDEMSNDTTQTVLNYYAAIYDAVKNLSATHLVVANPGTITYPPYFAHPTADVLVTFENFEGYPAYAPQPWTLAYPSTAFAQLIYRVTSADTMHQYVALAARRHAGYVFVADDTLPNPWDTLPGYWGQEIAVVETTQVQGSLLSARTRDPIGSEHAALSLRPNPIRAGEAVQLNLTAHETVWLQIIDAAGRVAGAPARQRFVPGEHHLTWTSKDTNGSPLAPGIYFVIVTGPRTHAIRRLIVLR